MSRPGDIATPITEGEPSETEPPQPGSKLLIELVEDGGDWSSLAESGALAEAVARAIATSAALSARFSGPASACVALSSDAAVKALNAAYRGQDKPTNVLSFPAVTNLHLPPGEPIPLGDVVLADGVVHREAAERGLPLADHVRHLIVHGVLHLMGFDHELEEEAEAMESIEREILGRLGVPDPYQESE